MKEAKTLEKLHTKLSLETDKVGDFYSLDIKDGREWVTLGFEIGVSGGVLMSPLTGEPVRNSISNPKEIIEYVYQINPDWKFENYQLFPEDWKEVAIN